MRAHRAWSHTSLNVYAGYNCGVVCGIQNGVVKTQVLKLSFSSKMFMCSLLFVTDKTLFAVQSPK